MFEQPEFAVLARQMNEVLPGKTVARGALGNSPHKFVWYNRTPDEFAALTAGKRVGVATARAKWLFLPLEPGYVMTLSECGGKVRYHEPGAKLPKKHHLHLAFEDGSFLTATTQMWGGMEVYEAGAEQERDGIRDMRPTPLSDAFTLDYFHELVDEVAAGKKRSVKGLLTQDALIPGLGNAIAQDIMFLAGLHPKRPAPELTLAERERLYQVIQDTVRAVQEQGGRYDEYDLYGQRGGYVRLMDRYAVGRPCPSCGGEVRKISYLGGSCYLCPVCQV